MNDFEDGLTEDAFLGGKLRLRQPKSGHRAGHDAMLLAAATPARTSEIIGKDSSQSRRGAQFHPGVNTGPEARLKT